MIRELDRPTGIEGDDRATEMIRVWLANNDLNVSLFLGMWEDADDSEIDERDAWGFLLADLTRHIANGMMQSHGWDYDESRERIKESFLRQFHNKNNTVEGNYPNDEE